MSTIFEIFGFRLDDDSPEAVEHRKNAWCPFMNRECDGGGNRQQTKLHLMKDEHRGLRKLYPNRETIIPGVCSLHVGESNANWIVCPRRLLVMGREASGQRRYTNKVEERVVGLLSYPSGTRLGIWPEVSIEYTGETQGIPFSFDYTFDYILMPTETVNIVGLLREVEGVENVTPRKLTSFKNTLKRNGYNVEDDWVHNFPVGAPSIIEIMTSSTSGQNKAKRTQIAQAFEDALTTSTHNAPGINYRQVWSRMVGQLFVKSEVALGWNGVTIWVLQDTLMKYISATTRLNIYNFVDHEIDEVNILTFGYEEDLDQRVKGILNLDNPMLYSGKLTEQTTESPSFTDIVRASVQPPYSKLINVLITRGPAENYIIKS